MGRITLPNMPESHLMFRRPYSVESEHFYDAEQMRQYARTAVKMNVQDEDISQQAAAWRKLWKRLNRLKPGLSNLGASGVECALAAIKQLVEDADKAKDQPAAKQEPKPFNLEAAKAGEPIVTLDGRKARFVAHVPEAKSANCVIAIPEGKETPLIYSEDGRRFSSGPMANLDLLMAPKPKRTVWVNLWNEPKQ